MDIGAILTVANSAIDLIKKIKDAEFENEKADLLLALSELKKQVYETQEEIRQKDTELQRLNGLINLDKKVKFIGWCYVREDEPSGAENHYCPRCYDAQKRLTHLIESDSMQGWWKCKLCGCTVTDESWRRHR